MLLEKGASINLADELNDRTALASAICCQHNAVVQTLRLQTLLEYDPDINWKDGDDGTPLEWPVCQGNEVLVRMLLRKGAFVSKAVICYAISASRDHPAKGNIAAITFLLDQRDEVINETDKDGASELMYAAELGYLDVVHLLVERGAKVTCNPQKANPL